MRLHKGKKIQAPIFVSGELIKDSSYEVKVLDMVHQGEHFNIYQGEDIHGMNVCLKVIRYRSEKKDIFNSAMDYVIFRRKSLLEEQKVLTLSYPCVPEPLALLMVENDSPDDKRLFRKIPEWEKLSYQEPILVQEFFSASPLEKIQEELKRFSLNARLDIIRKVAKMCAYFHKRGYILQNLTPGQILMNPSNEDNVYLVGMHTACPWEKGGVDRLHPGFGSISGTYSPGEVFIPGHNYDTRIDLFQIGVLFYYLLTFHDPCKDSNWWKNPQDSFFLDQENQRLRKAIQSLDSSALWIQDLILALTKPFPETRIPDIETLLYYLENPPRFHIDFDIVHATQESIEIRLADYMESTKGFKVRIENPISTEIFEKEYNAAPCLSLPGKGIGEIFCSIASVDQNSNLSWWHSRATKIVPETHFSLKNDLGADRFGVVWEEVDSLHHVGFTLVDESQNSIFLGNFKGSEVVFPSGETVLPFYKKYRLECVPYYSYQSLEITGNTTCFDVLLLPSIPEPVLEKEENIVFSMVVPKRQAQMYAEIELLHNGWPKSCKNIITHQQNQTKIALVLEESLDIFEEHQFAFRVLIENIGWRTGNSIVYAPELYSPQRIEINEEKSGMIKIEWELISHPQLLCYEIKMDGKKTQRVQQTEYIVPLTLEQILKEEEQEIFISSVYYNGKKEKLSIPASCLIKSNRRKNLFQEKNLWQVSPFAVSASWNWENHEILSPDSIEFALVRKKEGDVDKKTIGISPLQKTISFLDKHVEVGKKYFYSLVLNQTDVVLEKEVVVPGIHIQTTLQHLGYEDLLWEIHIAQETAQSLDGEIEIIQEVDGKKESSYFKWSEEEGVYYFEKKRLTPGTCYTYTLYARFKENPEPYSQLMGVVTTKEYNFNEAIQPFYNRASITWNSSSADQIEALEIYDSSGRFIASTKSDSITLENLEPERLYKFPLKYRYSSKKVMSGKTLVFTTLPYTIPAQAKDIEIDSFRLYWDVPDMMVARRIKEFQLEVSGNVGKHILSRSTRSVHLKHLYPCTTYQWNLCALLKSGNLVHLAKGETTTQTPQFTCQIDAGLVHHLQWDYPDCPAIDRIELHRDDVPVLQTNEKEMYDSDFKGAQEVSYKFYYVLKDDRKILAEEKKVKPLSMSHLFAALQIDPSIGSIRWDFSEFKKLKNFKYIELYQDEQLLYKQGSHIPSLTFEDFGKWNEKQNAYMGLISEPCNYRLAVVGVAPTARKCKKKWTLNIKGIQCFYPDVPECFSVAPEHCCIYFDWESSETPLLREIILRRAGDGEILYQGGNQGCTICDDNGGYGLEWNRNYRYTIEMFYNNYHTIKSFDVALDSYDPSRLEIKSRTLGDVLEVTWNSELETSIVKIGWQRVAGKWLQKRFIDMFKKPLWTDFEAGMIVIPLSGKEFYYQMIYQDRYGHLFETDPQSVNNDTEV